MKGTPHPDTERFVFGKTWAGGWRPRAGPKPVCVWGEPAPGLPHPPPGEDRGTVDGAPRVGSLPQRSEEATPGVGTESIGGAATSTTAY